MPRTITINYARVTSPPLTTWNPQTSSGTIKCSYVVGYVLGGVYTDYPACALIGTASITVSPTDTAAESYARLQAAIAANEGLNLSGGDQVILPAS